MVQIKRTKVHDAKEVVTCVNESYVSCMSFFSFSLVFGETAFITEPASKEGPTKMRKNSSDNMWRFGTFSSSDVPYWVEGDVQCKAAFNRIDAVVRSHYT